MEDKLAWPWAIWIRSRKNIARMYGMEVKKLGKVALEAMTFKGI